MELLHDRVSIGRIAPMTRQDYCPGGCTALLDAVGDAIRHIGNVHKYARKEDVPEHTLFVITTDGMENASHRHTLADVKRLISRQQEKYGWEFIFLGANIDAVGTAQSMGISADRAAQYHSDGEGTRANFRALDQAVSCVRASRPMEAAWKREIEEDHKRRRGG